MVTILNLDELFCVQTIKSRKIHPDFDKVRKKSAEKLRKSVISKCRHQSGRHQSAGIKRGWFHTIRKVKFLSKYSILTKPRPTFSRVFHTNFFLTIFLVKSKLNFWTKNEDFEQCVVPTFNQLLTRKSTADQLGFPIF